MTAPYSMEYFNERVPADIERWPPGLLAGYARLVELLMEFGPDVRMPHSRASRLREEDAEYAGAGDRDRPPPDEGGA